MTYDRDIVISTAGGSKSRVWLPQPTSWSAFAGRLKSPQWGQETMEEYLALPKAEQDSRKDVGGYVGGTLQGKRRRKGEVLGRDLVTLDMDALPQDGVAQVIRKLDILTCGWALYSTRRHQQDTPRLRVVIPLSKTIPGEDYEAAARMLAYWTQLA
ncbi:MAG: virulence-associated protein E, partial [Clostridiales bacterium]|nr:virulence-associated protein E [Clostridiales bacterium]